MVFPTVTKMKIARAFCLTIKLVNLTASLALTVNVQPLEQAFPLSFPSDEFVDKNFSFVWLKTRLLTEETSRILKKSKGTKEKLKQEQDFAIDSTFNR